jgi:hypothetical protein
VSGKPETPFDSLEGSHEYVAMLAEAIAEAMADVDNQVAVAESEGAARRKEALLLVSYNLAKLDVHVSTSRRILNDLRSLRRLLLGERIAHEEPAAGPGEVAAGDEP